MVLLLTLIKNFNRILSINKSLNFLKLKDETFKLHITVGGKQVFGHIYTHTRAHAHTEILYSFKACIIIYKLPSHHWLSIIQKSKVTAENADLSNSILLQWRSLSLQGLCHIQWLRFDEAQFILFRNYYCSLTSDLIINYWVVLISDKKKLLILIHIIFKKTHTQKKKS